MFMNRESSLQICKKEKEKNVSIAECVVFDFFANVGLTFLCSAKICFKTSSSSLVKGFHVYLSFLKISEFSKSHTNSNPCSSLQASSRATNWV